MAKILDSVIEDRAIDNLLLEPVPADVIKGRLNEGFVIDESIVDLFKVSKAKNTVKPVKGKLWYLGQIIWKGRPETHSFYYVLVLDGEVIPLAASITVYEGEAMWVQPLEWEDLFDEVLYLIESLQRLK